MPYVPYRTVRDKTSQKLRGSIYELPRSNVFNRRLLPSAADDGLIAYGSFSSTVTQPVTAGTPLALTYDTKDLTTTPNVTAVLSPASSQITVSLNGIYTVLTSIQVDQTTTLNDLEFYVSINGTAVPNSGSRLAITANIEDVFTVEWMLELVAGDSVEVYLSSASAGFRALAIAASAPVPLIPSVITNIKRIANYNPTLIITTTGAPVVTTSGGRTYYRFTGNGSFQTNIPVSVNYLALGGGGGGGANLGGGGGAGGLRQATAYTLPTGLYPITIGDGGAGGIYTGGDATPAVNGNNTSFATLAVALGGGGGGSANGFPNGSNGGCGGGAVMSTTPGVGSRGFDGSGSGRGGGGGGGVGSAGNNVTTGAGVGGDGIMYNIGSSVLQIGGGGGGGAENGRLGGSGSYGGGTGGGTATTVTAGELNKGGGGGGSYNSISGPWVGGKGGSGVFIISYVG